MSEFVVNICGKPWQVQLVDTLGEDEAGECISSERKILIGRQDKPELVLEVLFHELAHAQQFEMGFHHFMSHEVMEMSAHATAQLMLELFKDFGCQFE